MIIQQTDPPLYVPRGQFVESSISSEESEGSQYSFGGCTYADVTGAATSPDYRWIPETLDAEDVVTTAYEAPGAFRLALVSNGRCAIQERLSLAVSGGVVTQRFYGWNGGYGAYSGAIALEKMEAPGAEISMCNADATQWNTNCWGWDWDLTGVVLRSSQANGNWTKERGGVLVTPRHIVIARHYPISVGQKVRFLTRANVLVERTVIAWDSLFPSYNDSPTDNLVCLLDSDVPASIKHYPLLSGDAIETDDGVNVLRGVALRAGKFTDLVAVRSVSKSFVGGNSPAAVAGKVTDVDMSRFTPSVPSSYDAAALAAWLADYDLVHGAYPQFFRPVLLGDSGSPTLGILDGSNVCYLGVSTATSVNELNDKIASADSNAGVSTGYTVTVALDPTA